jgi:hypothetical protein
MSGSSRLTMQAAAVLLLIICYGLAGYLSWLQRTPIYLFSLAAGHVSALASPLWELLYGVQYNPSLDTARTLLGQEVPLPLLLGAGWFYPLPALVVLYLTTARWWFPGALTGVLTYLVFLLYHLLIETLGLRTETWRYELMILPLGLSTPLLAAVMGGLVSYGMLYVLLAVCRSTWPSMLLAVLPAALLLSLLIHGLLGAPLWAALQLDGQAWAVLAGLLSTIMLLVWAAQIITAGIRRLV